MLVVEPLVHRPLPVPRRAGEHGAEIDLGELYQRGFADVAASDTPEDETARRILGLARTHRRQQVTRRALDGVRGSGLTDASTGLFTPRLFAAHLTRVAQAARLRQRPLSVCVLRVRQSDSVVASRTGGWLDRALPQIGAMVSRLVRVEDTAARLAPEVFALTLPATRAGEARLAAERIAIRLILVSDAFERARPAGLYPFALPDGRRGLLDGGRRARPNPSAEERLADYARRGIAGLRLDVEAGPEAYAPLMERLDAVL